MIVGESHSWSLVDPNLYIDLTYTMRFAYAASVLFATLALAAPVALQKRAALGDIDILQFALTLEHLENAFFKQGLSTWSVDEFVKANFTESFYSQLKYITHDEETHVLYLEAALKTAGATPVAACSYKFPMTNPHDFVALAATIDGVGAAAYLGAAPLLTSKSYLTAAASILVTEALHQSATRNAVGEVPMANPFGTPMGANAVYSIASQFITSCPDSNTPLPVKPYPGLTISQGMPVAVNTSVSFSVDGQLPSAQCYITFVSGLDILPVEGSVSNGMISAEIPSQVSGQSYAFVTSDNSGNLTDTSILFGPAVLEVTPSSPTFDLSIT
ncbi:LANO_0B00298g1_1 [Lachancea nothofagi CBS 11611]|uniref:LANO_0B00298g1_1 n=1 Tax=Lachancea nothofagi CBS 11611 TaxID=1266666 RepID=A0A1G4IUR7_9SACH|nr:LANO_0B00298g1_1 [Lachancea nothofagi CBS 11611]